MLRTKWIFFISFSVIAVGCGGGKNDDVAAGASGGVGGQNASNGTAGTATNDLDGGATNPDNPKVVVKTGQCGDQTVQAPEECDDGNNVDNDGCSNGCEWNCKKDDDCKRDIDVCSGGTMTCNLTTHACQAGAGKKADGEPCNDNSWCFNGKCYKLECGNGVLQKGEECDDGNSDDADGCTKRCKWTCTANDKGSALNPCDPTATCGADHKWKAGIPLANNAVCDRGQGYCLSGVCMYSVCGDGKKDVNEECDLGKDVNGTSGAACTAKCALGVCGNGVRESNEQCDDGNTANLDGCDYHCKVEVTHRGTRMDLSTEPAPSYCYYANAKTNPNFAKDQGNAFKDMFPVTPGIESDGGTFSSILDLVNSAINTMMDNGTIQTLFYSMDVDDYSGKTEDPIASLGLAMGETKNPWPTADLLGNMPSTLDLEVYAYTKFFDKGLQPLVVTPGGIFKDKGEFSGKPVPILKTNAPINAGFTIQGNTFALQKLMARLEVDGKFSALTYPSNNKMQVDPAFVAPETIGNWVYPASGASQKATAVLCGAFHESSFDKIPAVDIFGFLCTDQLNYRYCASDTAMKDLENGTCDSMLKIFKGGCSGLIGTVLNKLGEPTVDTDGDGKPDSYTTVLRVSAQRIRIIGTKEQPVDAGTQ
jgi:cysteine-rich repeat protein